MRTKENMNGKSIVYALNYILFYILSEFATGFNENRDQQYVIG